MTLVAGVSLAGGLADLRRPWRQLMYATLDLETTGLDPDRDAIVSFGVVPIEGGRVRLDSAVYRVVRPDRPVSARSVSVHGIRPVDLQDAPSLAEVSGELRTALQHRVLVAWASWVEAGFLSRAIGGRAGRWERHIIDVARLVPRLDATEGRGTNGSETLTETVARFGLPTDQAHHALWDAFMTAELFLAVATRFEARGWGDVRSMVRGRHQRIHR